MKNILFCTYNINKNFEKCFFMYYFDCLESPKRTLKLHSNMLKYSIKVIFSVGLIVVLTTLLISLNYNFYTTENINLENSESYIVVEDDNNLVFSTNETESHFEDQVLPEKELNNLKFGIIPEGLFSGELSKTQLIITHFLMAFVCLLISTQFHVETNMYEFFNKSLEGTILFENRANEITHYLSIYTGLVFKTLGVTCIFLAIFALVI